MGQVKRAEADYGRAVERGIAPDASIQFNRVFMGEQVPAYAYLFECAAYQARGETQAALASCDEALERSPGYFDGLWKRGQLYVEQGDLNSAAADYTAAIQLDASWPWVYFLRAQALAGLGQDNAAQADLAQALALDPVDELRQQIERFEGEN
jgi:tetratricopeptide (TPR) repeat protein